MFLRQVRQSIRAATIVVLFVVAGCGYDGPIIAIDKLKAALDDSK